MCHAASTFFLLIYTLRPLPQEILLSQVFNRYYLNRHMIQCVSDQLNLFHQVIVSKVAFFSTLTFDEKTQANEF